MEWAQVYRQPGNPLFIPETGRGPDAMSANALHAFGALNAIGFSPFAFDGAVDDKPQDVRMGNYTLHVVFRESAEDTNTVARGGLIMTFETPGAVAGLESVWEGRFEGGKWITGRLLNGDQTHQGRHVRLPRDRFDLQRARLHRYQQA